jgi:hypothetical protein
MLFSEHLLLSCVGFKHIRIEVGTLDFHLLLGAGVLDEVANLEE